jgi:flagellar protein FlaG
MANEISSMIMAQVPRQANESGQFVKLQAVKVPGMSGQSLPSEGKELPQQSSEKSSSKSELRQAVSEINSYVQKVQRDLSFSMDEASGRTIIKVIDSESGKLVRQIPNEEVLALATYLQGVREDVSGAESAPQGLLFSDSI